MTLSIGVSEKDGVVQVAMQRLNTGGDNDPREVPTKMCNWLEPAIYEAVKQSVEAGIIPKATVLWDGKEIRIKQN